MNCTVWRAEQIHSQYVCRLDADDIALPTRLEKQHAYMESHPDIDVCSSWMELFHAAPDGRASQVLAKPAADAAIKTAMIQYCALSHPACMIRRHFFDDVGVFDSALDFRPKTTTCGAGRAMRNQA